MKKKLISCFVILCMVVFFASPVLAERAPVTLEVGGAAAGTNVFAGHVALADVVARHSGGNIRLNVQETAGSTAHPRMMVNGDISMGTSSGFADFFAFNGGHMLYPESVRDYFGTALVIQLNFQSIIVHANSDIHTVQDLAGRRVGIGSAGSPGADMAIAVLEALGVQNVQFSYLSTAEVGEMFIDRQIDAMITTNPRGNALLLNVTTNADVRFLSLTEEGQARAVEFMNHQVGPGMLTHDDWPAIPLGEPVYVIRDFSGTNIALSVPDDVVYDIVRIYWDNIEEVRAAIAANDARIEDITSAVAWFHPGAAQFYISRGIDIPADRIAVRR